MTAFVNGTARSRLARAHELDGVVDDGVHAWSVQASW